MKIQDLFYFLPDQETPEEIVEEIVRRLQTGAVPDVEGLIVIREMVKKMAVKRKG